MTYNSINSIIEAVLAPQNFFKTVSDFSVETHQNGTVMFYPSNFAITFKILLENKYYALKCYTNQNDSRQKHFSELKKFFLFHNRDYFVDFQYLQNEIALYDEDKIIQHDALLTPWIEGKTFYNEIIEAAHLGEKEDIFLLRRKFLNLVADFSAIGFAHGDLKPQNIIFEKDTQTLKVIDYDASWIKPISHLQNREVGTYWYQHPQRDNTHWGYNVDNYSIVLIAISLIAIENHLPLFEKYNNKENILFSPEEVINGRSIPYKKLLSLWCRESTLLTFLTSLNSIVPYADNINEFINEVERYETKLKPIDKANIIDDEGEYRRYFNEFGLYGYVDSNSNIALYAQWNDATAFEHGKAIVRGSGASYFVYNDCQVSTEGFDKIELYDCSHAIVRCGKKFGVVNLSNFNYILNPIYCSTTLFTDGIAVVSTNGKYFLIDDKSKQLSNSKYDYCSGYNGEYCVVMNDGEYWIVDKSENQVSEKTSDKLLYVKEGYLYRFLNNEIVKERFNHSNQNICLPL